MLPYLPALGYGFVYDDAWTVVGNPWLRRPLADALRRCLNGTAPRAGIPAPTRPAMTASIWLDVALHRFSPAWMHFTSLCLHGLVCALATVTAFALMRHRARALAAGALFAVCASHAEAVMVINYREDLLAAAGVLVAVSVVHWPTRDARRSLAWDALAALAWLTALCAKENAVALVPVVLFVAMSRRAPTAWAAAHERTLAWLLAALAVWGCWRTSLAINGDDLPRAVAGPAFDRALRFARYECWMLRASLFPLRASPVYDTAARPAVAYLAGFGLELAVAAYTLRKPSLRAIGLGLAWILAASLPTSPLARPANEFADRYVLLPSLGGAMCWVGLASIALRAPRVRWAVLAAAGLADQHLQQALGWDDEHLNNFL
ncbi:MAG: hypothetical protein WCJ30_09175, partial [Deltaproteobacteria bacterium]